MTIMTGPIARVTRTYGAHAMRHATTALTTATAHYGTGTTRAYLADQVADAIRVAESAPVTDADDWLDLQGAIRDALGHLADY